MSDKIVFGLAEYRGAIAGVRLQNFSYSESGSTAEAVDEDGYVEQIDHFAKKRSIQCDGNIIEGGDRSAMTVGADLTVNGVTYRIDSVNERYVVNGHATFSITASAPLPKPVTSDGA